METVSLEHFDTGIQGATILCYGTFTRYPAITEYIKHPIKKRVLITNSAFGLNTHFPFHYDAVFQGHDGNDWTMIVTHLTYVAKPALVVCDIPVPDGLWKKLSKDITFIHCTKTIPPMIKAYQCIFFGEDAEAHRVLQNVYKASYSHTDHKEILHELKVADAGLVWCNKDDVITGGLYWYDQVAPQPVLMSKGQMGELFQCLSRQFL